MTLAEGYAAYRAANPNLLDGIDPEGRSFFRSHDLVHVIFGCSTDLLNEAMADSWTLFGTTVGFSQFLAFLKLEDHKQLIREVGLPKAIVTFLRAIPLMVRIFFRSRRMNQKWPWRGYDAYLDILLKAIRNEFGIQVLYRGTK